MLCFTVTASSEINKDDDAFGIQFKQNINVTGQKICMGDIVEITGDEGFANRIREINLGPAPGLGKDKIFSGDRIASIFKTGQLLPENYNMIIPDQIVVSRKYQEISKQKLEELYQDYVIKTAGRARLEISEFSIRGEERFPVGSLHLELSEPLNKRIAGRIRIKVKVYVDENESGHVYVTGWIDRYEDVVCAKQFISKNNILTEEDLVLKSINVTRVNTNLVTRIEDAVGMKLRQKLTPGSYLRENILEEPPLVEKGDRVKLVAESGLLSIITIGIAKADGVKGDQIKVENISSGKIVVGRVLEPGVVSVLF
ncbi:MAG: flagellar basal body P-ring formation protein FlgA [Desulfobacterales bacterium]|nr:flagellar basal body P-ring formation protein FlgA [Desulfobacterales bacterium]